VFRAPTTSVVNASAEGEPGAMATTTLNHDTYHPVPAPTDNHVNRGYGASALQPSHLTTDANDFAPVAGYPTDSSPVAQSMSAQRPSSAFGRHEGLDQDDRGSTIQQLEGAGLHRTASSASGGLPSRSNTLKKKSSLSRRSSLKRSGSRRSLHAGSLKGVAIDDKREPDQMNSVFYTPVPTTGAPTDILANRFQAWRKMLKDLITYFREVQASYEHKSKALLKVSNVINNTAPPTVFTTDGGLSDANRILRDYHRQAITEANKARDIEQDVITQLTGLRQDLAAKIKEIKSLSGDFKNSVEKEKENTRRAVAVLEEALGAAEHDPHAVTGKDDPFIIRLNVDRQVERQIDEENYLHRAYLNLEGSGRELESIVVGEIQKAYNALAGIMKREADEAYDAIDQLRSGPITIPKDLEWGQFVERDPHFISPDVQPRKLEYISYPGKTHPAAAEVRSGMLERKSKYLKSYTPGWYVCLILSSEPLLTCLIRYVLSPTHLHEFKSADRIYTQPPVMSLYLADQKLGSHSQPGSSSHKFMLKGKQTGAMHRGHSWVFRAETYDTMLAWYDDIKSLTEKSGEERNAFVRKHVRSFSGSSTKAGSVSGDSALEEDEADEVPYSANQALTHQEKSTPPPQRPSPGGRFPSDLNANQYLQRPTSLSEGSSDDRDIMTAAGGLPQHFDVGSPQTENVPYRPLLEPAQQHSYSQSSQYPNTATTTGGPYPTHTEPQKAPSVASQVTHPTLPPSQTAPDYQRHDSNYGSWMAPAAGGAAVGASAIGAEEYWQDQRRKGEELEAQQERERQAAVNGNNLVPPEPMKRPSNGVNDRAISDVATSPTRTESTAPTTVSGFDQEMGNVTPVVIPSTTAGVHTQPTATTAENPMFAPATVAPEGLHKQAVSSTVVPNSVPSSSTTTAQVVSHTAYDTNRDGSINAHGTGNIFPILRHDTDTSISNLHVPGEFPRASNT
jgi:hypothetical protein